MPSLSTAITLGGISCWDEGLTYELGISSGKATRIIRVPWKNWRALYRFLRGGAQTVGGVLTYTSPQTLPDDPGLYVSAVQVVGVPGTNGASNTNNCIAYENAVLTVTYSTNDYSDTKTILSSVEIGNSVEIISLPKEAVKFSSDGATLPNGAAITIPITTYMIYRKNLSDHGVANGQNAYNPQQYEDATAKPLNSGRVSFPSLTVATPKTLRFNGAKSFRRQAADGVLIDVGLSFSKRAIPWDQFIRKDTGAWDTVVRQDGSPLLETSDLQLVLK